MGEAKRRGTEEERIAQAIERDCGIDVRKKKKKGGRVDVLDLLDALHGHTRELVAGAASIERRTETLCEGCGALGSVKIDDAGTPLLGRCVRCYTLQDLEFDFIREEDAGHPILLTAFRALCSKEVLTDSDGYCRLVLDAGKTRMRLYPSEVAAFDWEKDPTAAELFKTVLWYGR